MDLMDIIRLLNCYILYAAKYAITMFRNLIIQLANLVLKFVCHQTTEYLPFVFKIVMIPDISDCSTSIRSKSHRKCATNNHLSSLYIANMLANTYSVLYRIANDYFVGLMHLHNILNDLL